MKTPIEQPQKVATGFITQQPIGPQLPTEAELEAVDLLPGTRLLTTQEAVALLLSDFDGDGVPAIRDASPRDGGIRTRSEALVSVKLKKDPVEALITLFESTEAMCEYALEENLQDPIFDSEALIHAAERAGMEQKVCDRWRKRFVKGGK